MVSFGPRNRKIFVPIVISFICSVALSQGSSVFAPTSGVIFSVRPDQRQYEIGDQITIRYLIQNISGRAMFVPRAQWDIKCGNPPHLWAQFVDSSSNELPTGYAGSCLGPDPTDQMRMSERIVKDAVLLQPMQTVKGSFSVDSKVLLDKLRSGRYLIRVSLYGWSDKIFTAAQLAELSATKALLLGGQAQSSARIVFARSGSRSK